MSGSALAPTGRVIGSIMNPSTSESIAGHVGEPSPCGPTQLPSSAHPVSVMHNRVHATPIQRGKVHRALALMKHYHPMWGH